MTIYEEVIELLDSKETFMEINLSTLWILEYSDYMSLVGVIKKAQQQEKLLELYKRLNELHKELLVTNGTTRKLWNQIKEIENQIKELENGNRWSI